MADDDSTYRSEPPSKGLGAHSFRLRWLFPEGLPDVTLEKSSTLLGRAASCDVCIPGQGVSRVHAEVRKQGVIWVLKDLDSTNGTFVDGKRVQRQLLADSTVVRIGSYVGLIESSCSSMERPFREVASGVWGSVTLEAAIAPAMKVATSNLPIAISGETGVGKERVAQAIHVASGRTGAFVGVNCATIPNSLADSLFFGHAKGAFTGADQSALGYLRAADNGTLFLDEVAELPPPLQSKLLRALQEREVIPVGVHRPVPVNLRVLVACQKPLESYVAAEGFRRDLMMRVNGLEVSLPPLRKRVGEILHLLKLFTHKAAEGRSFTFEPKLVEALCVYPWPGNVRQLELVAQRLVALSDDFALRYADLPEQIVRIDTGVVLATQRPERDATDLEYLTDAMKQTGGNVAAAAKRINISRQRAYRLLTETKPSGVLRRYREAPQ